MKRKVPTPEALLVGLLGPATVERLKEKSEIEPALLVRKLVAEYLATK